MTAPAPRDNLRAHRRTGSPLRRARLWPHGLTATTCAPIAARAHRYDLRAHGRTGSADNLRVCGRMAPRYDLRVCGRTGSPRQPAHLWQHGLASAPPRRIGDRWKLSDNQTESRRSPQSVRAAVAW
ncbi:hypothetical protein GCM10009744_01690 [Kribbella alba]|uniref:Uncharacterized protein n=1 Tax=Kribbella alba TaxID=190197 RepID=A0ABN2EVA9_9ACTN